MKAENKNEDMLLDEIKRRNEEYRKGHPTISDAEYDALIEQLHNINPDNEWFKHIEPAFVNKSRKCKLPIPMKSLYKVKDIKSLQNWIQSLGISEEDMIVVTPKFDGLSLLHNERTGMTYSRGGSDNEGQNCTEHYKAMGIKDVESNLEYTYGEFVFSRHTWETLFCGKVSQETGEKYKSPRNTAAGLLNRDVPSNQLKNVDFFRYGTDSKSLSQFSTYVELYTYLCRTFNQEFLYSVIRVKDFNEAALDSLFTEWSKYYYIDGLVLYANDLNVWKRVGRQETTGNPNYAIAYKNPNFTECFQTTVLGVDWNISKAGALKPVVKIETVNTGDCDMENPTGYNAKYISDKRIGKGAVIKVTRSGGVIPKILEVIKPASDETLHDMWDELAECPECGSPTAWNGSMVDICCTNPHCSGVQLAKIIFFYNTLGVDNMGEETIGKIFKAGFHTLKEILDITFEELMDIRGFGESISNIVLANNKKIRAGIEITKLMHASDCFPGIGSVKAKKILLDMSDEERYAFSSGMLVSDNVIKHTPDFQSKSKTYQAFVRGITPFMEFVATNRLVILPLEKPKVNSSGKYSGFNVCFTGVRDTQLEKDIESGGGSICNGVSKKTTHLIVADLDSTSTKMQKARKLGISIMTIEKFKESF